MLTYPAKDQMLLLHSILDNDTSIRDVLVLIHEGGRLRKQSSIESINPQIADLYSACAIHIEEMSSVQPFSFPHPMFILADGMSSIWTMF